MDYTSTSARAGRFMSDGQECAMNGRIVWLWGELV